jgi:hypothetical protein
MKDPGMKKRDPYLSMATIAADAGLFVHLGDWRLAELELLKKGAGCWMRRIDAAMENWREDIGAGNAQLVIVVLLFRCCGRGLSGCDASEPVGPEDSGRSRKAAPIVVELGQVVSSQIEDLLLGRGKILEETRETMRLVQLKAADKRTTRFFLPVVATYDALQRPRRWKKAGSQRGRDCETEDGLKTMASIRYVYASPKGNRANQRRITIV